jgi:DNA end-binding protein Ku
MPARALSTATISFGLVSIPVKLYSAAESKAALAFNQIHKKDGSRVKQQLISARSGDIVPREEIVKGYEFAKDQYVLFEPEELKALEAAATHTIDITEFLKAEQIERRYLDKVYYLGTDKGGARAYKLLAQVLVDTGRIAIGKYAARGKQYLVMVRPMENGLVMEKLHYPDELRAFSEVPIEDATLKPAEVKLATQLVEQAASDEFKPESYKDEVRERMLALIQHQVPKIRHILTTLEAAASGKDMDLPGFRLHALKGDLKGFWAVRVSGNWRIIFRFENGEAADIDLIDYH